MDFLKVLSRGTNVGKGAAKNATAAKTPSSGASANPQLFGRETTVDDQSVTPATQSKTKKRKRGQNHAVEAAVDLPPELDFFGDGKREDKKAEPEAVAEAGAAQDKADVKADAAAAAEGPEPLTEEESRRILRSHKVKITLLEDYKAQEAEQKAKEQRSKKRKKAKEQEASQQKKAKVQLFPRPLTSFGQLRSRFDVNRRLAGNIDAQGYTMPTEVQLASLPLLLDAAGPESNGIDLLTVAPTGSGKTLAFLIPVVESLLRRRRHARNDKDSSAKENEGVQAIVLAPTKELASQIANEGRKLSLKTGVKVSLMRKGMEVLERSSEEQSNSEEEDGDSEGSGGDSQEGSAPEDEKSTKETKTRRRGQLVKSDILVATPLALLHALQLSGGKTGSLPSVKYFVLDEADVLLDPLFREQTLGIWNACTSPLLRVSLWSATMGSSIEELAKTTITSRWESLHTSSSSNTTRPDLIRLVVGLKDSAVPNIHHQLTYAATEQGKLLAVRQLLHPTASPASSSTTPTLRPPFLIFTQTIPRAQALYSELQYDIPPEAGGSSRIAVLHSSLSASLRDGVMARFRRGEVWVLITTDLLARGVDFRGVNGVVNYDVPASGAAYVHRVGRTGRAGREGGVAVTLYTEEDIPFVKNVANVIRASEASRGKSDGAAAAEGKATVQQWLLDALPTPTKRDKKLLKKRGVEARRAGVELKQGRGKWRTQISTKPGFERKVEHNRKAAVLASRSRKEKGGGGVSRRGGEESEGEEFGGFDD